MRNGVQIAAAGHGTRIREAMIELGHDPTYPKHLLPTDDSGSETLLGRIVQQALEVPALELPTIHANHLNADWFRAHPDVGPLARIVINEASNFMMPFMDRLRTSRERVLGCAGDFFADFSWAEIQDAHESNKYPVTFMVGPSLAVDEGLTFDIADDGQIKAMERAERTAEAEPINIGVYVFDPHKSVLNVLGELSRNGQLRTAEGIAQAFIHEGLVGAYTPPIERSFNVNTLEVYHAMRAHNTSFQLAKS